MYIALDTEGKTFHIPKVNKHIDFLLKIQTYLFTILQMNNFKFNKVVHFWLILACY